MNEAELLIEYAKAWNHLDTSYLEDILADDFQYTSQWVFTTMHGKDNYIEYLSEKFKTILKNPASIPRAEMAYFKSAYGELNKPCIIISQNDFKASMIIKIANGKIAKADLVAVPHYSHAIRLNHFPK